jgi:hypothetical protein
VQPREGSTSRCTVYGDEGGLDLANETPGTSLTLPSHSIERRSAGLRVVEKLAENRAELSLAPILRSGPNPRNGYHPSFVQLDIADFEGRG